MAATVWKGYLTFGIISVPIRLFAAARREHVSFNMLHKECGTRVKQQLYCPYHERVVERSETVKGYEVSKDSFVVVDAEELKKIAPASERNMEIQQFVKIQDVDPIYFDTSYYTVPDAPGQKAYMLLVETMQKSGYAALAKVSMHNQEYLVVIRPQDNGLMLHTLYYAEELHKLSEYGKPAGVEVKPQEIELAERLVENLAAPFDPAKFKDEYQEKVLELIEAKRQGSEVQAAAPQRLAPVIDLMEALKKSLETAGKKPPAAATEAKPAEKKARSA
jgi:DNA end-binding protein Ku